VVDIEFVTQVLQLVHGGQNPALRTPETLTGLTLLHAAGHLDSGQFSFLEKAYRQLRTIEGHLRLLDAPARHDFPSVATEQRTLAHLMGYPSADDLVAEVESITSRTRREFDEVFNRLAASMP